MSKEVKKTDVEKISQGEKNINEIQVKLNEAINKFQFVNKLINDRNQFVETGKVIKKYHDQVLKEDEAGSLESSVCKISLQDSKNYRDDNVLKISNAFIVREFLEFIEVKIADKVKALEVQIVM